MMCLTVFEYPSGITQKYKKKTELLIWCMGNTSILISPQTYVSTGEMVDAEQHLGLFINNHSSNLQSGALQQKISTRERER